MIVRDDAPCIAGATVDVLVATLPWTPALSAKDHASDALPSVTLGCGASKDSPKIICAE